MSLAKKIVQLRKERNLTQKELASIVGVHFSHMSRYERGISLPSVDVVKKLAQMFHVSADYLLFEESQAMVPADITDQELLQQFERISRMSEREKSAVKILLEGLILKHHLEEMLGVKPAPADDEPVRSDQMPPWTSKHEETVLFQDLEEALHDSKRPGLTRRRTPQRI
ncbi:MAG: helix-turn-helix domain-containing protein [Candidatus Tectimicrobiota bacterium]